MKLLVLATTTSTAFFLLLILSTNSHSGLTRSKSCPDLTKSRSDSIPSRNLSLGNLTQKIAQLIAITPSAKAEQDSNSQQNEDLDVVFDEFIFSEYHDYEDPDLSSEDVRSTYLKNVFKHSSDKKLVLSAAWKKLYTCELEGNTLN